MAVPIIDQNVHKLLSGNMGLANRKFEAAAAESLLRWWRDAGVETCVQEARSAWLGIPGRVPSATSAPALPAARCLTTRQMLVGHLMSADLPAAGPQRLRVAPAGPSQSDLMILVDFPEPDDVDAKMALSDAVFDKMLSAIGRSRETVYIALLCPGRPLTGRLSDQAIGELAGLARDHIAFVAPKHLWLVGSAASRAILGFDDAQAQGRLHLVKHSGGIVAAIATSHPRMFKGSKSRKAAAWIEMQRLTAKDTQ